MRFILKTAAVWGLAFLLSSPFLCAAESRSSSSKSTPDIPVEDLFAKRKSEVEVVADQLEYDRAGRTIHATGNVTVRYHEMHLTSDEADVETDTKKVHAKGHVVIFRNGAPVSHGNEIHFDMANKTGSYPGGRVVALPWFITGQEMDQVKDGTRVVENGHITTCDHENPHYDIRASRVTVYDQDKMVARNVKIYVLNKPIFWWPYLVIPLQLDRNLPFNVSGGYNSRHGAYIETTKGFSLTKQIYGRAHVDYRAKRGFGAGGDIDYDFRENEKTRLLGRGVVKMYLTQDERAPTFGQENGFAELEERDRGRITWLHRTDIDRHTNLIFRYNRLADEFFLQDFFENESRAEIEPQSFLTFTKNSEQAGFFLHAEKKMNSFESMVERLPQARVDWKTQPFFRDNLFYENHFSYDNLAKRFKRSSMNEDAQRYDSNHEWSLPLQWRHLKFTPFTFTRGTYYSRELTKSADHLRGILGGGLDLRTHAYRTYDVEFEKLGVEVNQLRHVFEPSFQTQSRTSTVSDERLSQFDSVDQLDDANIITFGAENRIQTKRVVNGRMQRVDLVSLNTFLSYEMHPDGRSLASQNYPAYQDGRTSSNFSIASQEVVLRPYEWLQTESRFDYDVEGGYMRVFNQDVVARHGKFRFVFGYRRIHDFIGIEGSDQFVFDGSYAINALWAVGGYVRWDGSELQEWQISATRDLHDFILDFGYNLRNSDIENQNMEVFVNFRMKAFPEYALRSGRRASFGEPRIGETVAGANQNAPRYVKEGSPIYNY